MKIKFIILFLYALELQAFVHNRAQDGKLIKWDTSRGTLTLYVTPSNNNGISDQSIQTIVNNAFEQWRSENGIHAQVVSAQDGPQNLRNDFYFTSNSLLFSGSGVIGVTKIVVDNDTSSILESDIIINDNFLFSDTPGATYYVGDVTTHELGHFWGLGHSQVHGSTMFYKLSAGQSTLSQDDILGVKNLYLDSSADQGILRGQILGGESGVGVFGAYVNLVSALDGKVAMAVPTNEDGSFYVGHLDRDDEYFLYVEPLKNLESLPEFYSEVKNNFCLSEQSYRGAYFQSCHKSLQGEAIGINFKHSSEQNVGNVSIQCDYKLPNQYFTSKEMGLVRTIELPQPINESISFSKAETGFFSKSDIQSGRQDQYLVDLTTYDFSSLSEYQGKDLYLEIKTVAQSLFANTKLDMDVKLADLTVLNYPLGKDIEGVHYNDDGNPSLEIIARVDLNESVALDNIFEITLTPTDFSQFVLTTSKNEDDFFPSNLLFKDSLSHYLIMFHVVEKKADGSFALVTKKDFQFYGDNGQCLDGPNSFNVNANTFSSIEPNRREKRDQAALSCASISGPPGGGRGPFQVLMSFVLGFCLVVMFKHKYLSKLVN